jgi:16S rRNA (adenine1518-N6/adenine1519-N6)-dimethyltransferase
MDLTSKVGETSSHLPPNSAPPRSASEVKKLLKKYRLRPSRGLGQNFLIDKKVVKKVIATADLKPDDIILEIGPGLGVLTQELAKKVHPVKSLRSKFNGAGKVIAVEKDLNLVRILNNELKIIGTKNVKVVQGDILKILNSKFPIPNLYKIVANLPFYLTAPVIRKFLEADAQPRLMVLIVQKEVAQRICAKVPDMNLLAVSVQFYAQPKIISYVSKKSFWPQPEVDAAIIRIIPRKSAYGSALFRERFFEIVKAGFSQPRKQLINNLSKKLKIDKIKTESWLWKNNIQPNQRAETLSVKDWLKLTKAYEP